MTDHQSSGDMTPYAPIFNENGDIIDMGGSTIDYGAALIGAQWLAEARRRGWKLIGKSEKFCAVVRRKPNAEKQG